MSPRNGFWSKRIKELRQNGIQKLGSGKRFEVGLGANVLKNRLKIASKCGSEMAFGRAF